MIRIEKEKIVFTIKDDKGQLSEIISFDELLSISNYLNSRLEDLCIYEGLNVYRDILEISLSNFRKLYLDIDYDRVTVFDLGRERRAFSFELGFKSFVRQFINELNKKTVSCLPRNTEELKSILNNMQFNYNLYYGPEFTEKEKFLVETN